MPSKAHDKHFSASFAVKQYSVYTKLQNIKENLQYKAKS